MTKTLEIGDILPLGKGDMRRLVYVGGGHAKCETFFRVSGWKVDDELYPEHADVTLTDKQIEIWLSKK
jgi:hypothetical protein